MTTFLQTKKYEVTDNDYFWVRNVDYKEITISVTNSGTSSNPSHLQISTDKVNWESVTGHRTVELSPYQKCYVRDKDDTVTTTSIQNHFYFGANGYYEMGGSLPALIDYEHKDSVTSIPHNYFIYLAGGNATNNGYYFSRWLSKADKIDFGNITTIDNYGIYGMFSNCENLKTVPDLSSITTVGDYGMHRMFEKCINLTIAPDLSSITTVGDYGMYEMFRDCWNNKFRVLPDLSSLTTVGNNGMYSMFYNCAYAETGADLSSLTTIGSSALNYMYSYCYSLTEATYPNVSEYDASKTNSWLDSAGRWKTSTKTVNCPTGVVIPTDSTSGIPTGWTRVDY